MNNSLNLEREWGISLHMGRGILLGGVGGGIFFIGAKRHTKNKMIESARVILGKPIIICVH